MPPYPQNPDPIGQIMGVFSGLTPQQKAELFLQVKSVLINQFQDEINEHDHNTKVRHESIMMIRNENQLVKQGY
jgi:hypothetical protein